MCVMGSNLQGARPESQQKKVICQKITTNQKYINCFYDRMATGVEKGNSMISSVCRIAQCRVFWSRSVVNIQSEHQYPAGQGKEKGSFMKRLIGL